MTDADAANRNQSVFLDSATTNGDIPHNTKAAIETAAYHLHSCEILLLVTGAGFSADSGLATYQDVADIEAYRKRGWRYRDLCRPLRLESSTVNEAREKDVPCTSQGEKPSVPLCKEMMATVSHPAIYPDDKDIRHPKYFYGFWGQCINDYRKVRPHEGYEIIARWARDKNVCRKMRGDGKKTGVECDENVKKTCVNKLQTYPYQQTEVAREIRRITQRLERRSRLSSPSTATGEGNNNNNSSNNNNNNNNNSASPSHGNTQEPYHVSTNRAGAFFFFTSNVDAHSYDVFKSHEIRECHGNTEVWQCTNFGCGTNDTTKKGFASSINGMLDEDEGKESTEPKEWERRLWRLPLDHVFEVDPVTMSAPPTKAIVDDASNAKKSFDLASKSESLFIDLSTDHGSSATAKRQKSSAPGEPGYFPAEKVDEDTTGALSYLQNQFATSEHLVPINNHVSATLPAHIGDVHGKPRLSPLKNMHHPTNSEGPNYYLPLSPSENWPRCPRCNNLARPAVLMFYDLDWVNNSDQEQRWSRWCRSVLKLCKQRVSVNDSHVSEHASSQLKEVSPSSPTKTSQQQPLKVLILEIGCGFNVPTCRMVSEHVVKDINDRGGDATLVRINLTHPEADDEEIEDHFIGIRERGLLVLKEMDKIYQLLRAESGDKDK
ncbi:hypothetical protein ACHAW6_004894 [Cyclotella cf. meneghiniana]